MVRRTEMLIEEWGYAITTAFAVFILILTILALDKFGFKGIILGVLGVAGYAVARMAIG